LDVYGSILPLMGKLLDDDTWIPVSSDIMAIVFVKNSPENKQLIDRFRNSKDEVYNRMVVRASLAAQVNKINPNYLESLGDIFVMMAKTDDAIKAYKYALKRMPDNLKIREKLDNLMKEKSEVKK
jgi:tetratricopeptide (TPR) repeat protein